MTNISISTVPKILQGREDRIIELYKSEKTFVEIAKILNVGESSLTKAIAALGLKRMSRYKKRGYDIKKIEALEKLGLSHIEISKKLGVSISTLKNIYKHFGKEFSIPQDTVQVEKRIKSRNDNQLNNTVSVCPNKTNVLEKYADEIKELLDAGISKTEIARRYNVCLTTVFNFIYLMQIRAPIIRKCDDTDQIEKLFSHGLSQKNIAKKLNCSEKSVCKKLQELQLNRSRNKVKKYSLLNNQEDLIKELYLQGLSGSEIAQKVHAHPISVYNKIRKMGLTRANKHAEYKTKLFGLDEEIIKMRKKGMTCKEIGQAFGVTTSAVAYHLKKIRKQK